MKFIWSQIFAYCKQELSKVYFDNKRISELKNKLILNQTILRHFLVQNVLQGDHASSLDFFDISLKYAVKCASKIGARKKRKKERESL